MSTKEEKIEIRMVELGDLNASPTNPRKNFDQEKLRELKATRAAWPAAWAEVIRNLADKPLTGDGLRQLAKILVEVVATGHQIRRGVETRTGKTPAALLKAAKDDKDLRSLVWQLALGPGLGYDDVSLSTEAKVVFALASADWLKARKAAADAIRIRELVHEFVLRAEAKVILNCEAVTDVDCGAAEVLGSAGRYLRDYRGDLVVVRATREVKAVFNLTGAELQFADTEDDGVRLYGGKP